MQELVPLNTSLTLFSGLVQKPRSGSHFDGTLATRGSVTNPRFRCATSARRAFLVQVNYFRVAPKNSDPGLKRVRDGDLAGSCARSANHTYRDSVC